MALVAAVDSPLAAGAQVELIGWGNTSDAAHMTAPDRSARGLTRAIRKACAMAGVEPADVEVIAAHGTATVFSDCMEMTAYREVFGRPRPVFSIKGGTGHTLAATGLIQALVLQKVLGMALYRPRWA